MSETVNGLEPPQESASGRGKKVLFILLLFFLLSALLVIIAGIFYGDKVGVFQLHLFKKPTKIQSMLLPAEIEKLNFQDQFDRANKEIEKGNYQLAYSILNNVQGRAQDKELIEKAAFYRGSLAANYMNETDTALSDLHYFIEHYPTSNFVADAHYFLGAIYYDKKHDLVKAIYHFTTLIERYPEHNQVPSAEFLMQDAAKQLAREGNNVGLITKSPLGAFIPTSKLPLINLVFGFLASIGMPIAWLMTNLGKNKGSVVSSVKTIPSIISMSAVVLVIVSLFINFGLNYYKSSMDFERSADALKRVGIPLDKK